MAKYEISDQVKNNILIFLDRTELKGVEAEALFQAKVTLSNPIPEQEPKIDE